MKKFIVPFVALFAIAIAVISWKAKDNNAATVTNDSGCALFDGNGGLVLADSDHAVVTSNGNGTLTCRAKGVANTSGHAVTQDGFLCNTPAGITSDTHSTVSANGNSTLVCHVN